MSRNGGTKFSSKFKPVESKTQLIRYDLFKNKKKSLKMALIVKF